MFQFKQFSIEQSRTAMKVGTDGVLLGAWATIKSDAKYILDIGAGTALISLMIAQRTDGSATMVDGVEIDQASSQQAMENVAQSRWSDRVVIHNKDIASFDIGRSYDHIISNPPYFVDSLLSPGAARSVARHTSALSFEALIESVDRLLTNGGLLSVILPVAESALFDKVLAGRFVLTRRCAVHGRVGLAAKRYMSEYKRLFEGDVEYDSLAIENSSIRGDYSAEYRALTKDYYLKF